MYYVSLNLFSDLTIVFSQGALRSGVAAVLRCVLALALCGLRYCCAAVLA